MKNFQKKLLTWCLVRMLKLDLSHSCPDSKWLLGHVRWEKMATRDSFLNRFLFRPLSVLYQVVHIYNYLHHCQEPHKPFNITVPTLTLFTGWYGANFRHIEAFSIFFIFYLNKHFLLHLLHSIVISYWVEMIQLICSTGLTLN